MTARIHHPLVALVTEEQQFLFNNTAVGSRALFPCGRHLILQFTQASTCRARPCRERVGPSLVRSPLVDYACCHAETLDSNGSSFSVELSKQIRDPEHQSLNIEMVF